MNPADVVKQRMQMKYSPFRGSFECAMCIYQVEGLAAFYRSYAVQLASNVPYQAIHVMTYEVLQQVSLFYHFLCIITLGKSCTF
jgi:solute carrier family 25 iron transporter 28/37